MNISVMTFNIHKGKHALLTKTTLEHIRDFLASHSVDIVLIQEVIGADPKRKNFDQVAYLAEGIAAGFCYGPNLVVEKYHHGNAILSRYPIHKFQNQDLSTNQFEKRGILGATIELPNGRHAEAFCCHLNLLRGSRLGQIHKMADLIGFSTAGFSGPIFIGGDFNDWQKDANGVFINRGWCEVGMEAAEDREHFLTFPAWRPLVALDRIYYRSAKLIEASATTFGERGFMSDHLPILAKFEIL